MIDTSALTSYKALPSYRDVLPLRTPAAHLAYLDLVDPTRPYVDADRHPPARIQFAQVNGRFPDPDGFNGVRYEDGLVREREPPLQCRLAIDGIEDGAVVLPMSPRVSSGRTRPTKTCIVP